MVGASTHGGPRQLEKKPCSSWSLRELRIRSVCAMYRVRLAYSSTLTVHSRSLMVNTVYAAYFLPAYFLPPAYFEITERQCYMHNVKHTGCTAISYRTSETHDLNQLLRRMEPVRYLLKHVGNLVVGEQQVEPEPLEGVAFDRVCARAQSTCERPFVKGRG